MARRKKKLPIPPEHFIPVETLSHEGRGIAHIDGKAIFLRNALPEEKVRFHYNASKAKFAEGYATEIDNPSPQRVPPQCEHYNRCGGCSTQHIDHHTQLQLKQQTLLDHFQHFGNTAPSTLLPMMTGPRWNYRSKARLSCRFLTHAKKVFLGFREINGRMITAGKHCPILHPKFCELFEPLSKLITHLTIADKIPQLELAAGDQQSAIIFRHMADFQPTDLTAITDFAQTHDLHIYLQPKGPDSIHKLYPIDSEPRLNYCLPEYGIDMAFFPTDFTQVNMAINRKLIQKAIELLDLAPDETVLDLFCGLGNFTLPLAKYCKKVVGVEGCEAMVKRGYENASRNQINNVEFHKADLFEAIEQATWCKPHYQKLLLDPPRTGAQTLVEHIKQIDPNRIVYVSCNPATLARDAKILTEQGYRLHSAGIIDMFPHTSHVESIAVFDKDY